MHELQRKQEAVAHLSACLDDLKAFAESYYDAESDTYRPVDPDVTASDLAGIVARAAKAIESLAVLCGWPA